MIESNMVYKTKREESDKDVTKNMTRRVSDAKEEAMFYGGKRCFGL